MAVEKVVHHEDMDPVTIDPKHIEIGHAEVIEQIPDKGSKV